MNALVLGVPLLVIFVIPALVSSDGVDPAQERWIGPDRHDQIPLPAALPPTPLRIVPGPPLSSGRGQSLTFRYDGFTITTCVPRSGMSGCGDRAGVVFRRIETDPGPAFYALRIDNPPAIGAALLTLEQFTGTDLTRHPTWLDGRLTTG